MTVTPPKLLSKKLADLATQDQNEQLQSYVEERGVDVDTSVNWLLVRQLARSSLLNGQAKKALFQFICNNSPNRSWLWDHGFVTERRCECGDTDDVHHWLASCPLEEPDHLETQARSTKAQATKALEEQALPTIISRPEVVCSGYLKAVWPDFVDATKWP